MQQMIHKCCVLLGKKFGSFDRGLSTAHKVGLGAAEIPIKLTKSGGKTVIQI